MNQCIKIVKAEKRYFIDISKLHIEGIREGFLSTLGAGFLSQLYKGINKALGSGVFIALDKETSKIYGFVAFTEDVRLCYKTVLKKHFVKLAFYLLPRCFNLTTLKKIYETLMYPNKKKQDNENTSSRPELLSIVVDKKCRGLGVGQLLVNELEDHFRAKGIVKYYVVTHAVDKKSNGFYLKRGFKLNKEFENHSKHMNEYIKELI